VVQRFEQPHARRCRAPPPVTASAPRASAQGLYITFLALLGALMLSGRLTLRARRTYPRDTATALASEEAAAAT
jgi:hypothetical protein